MLERESEKDISFRARARGSNIRACAFPYGFAFNAATDGDQICNPNGKRRGAGKIEFEQGLVMHVA